MPGRVLIRAIRRRFQAAVIWAMVPMALISGRSVSGCLSPTGHFEPGCHCQAMQAARVSGQEKANPTCQCHCPCCRGGACCCCQGKANCCNLAAKTTSRTHGEGVQDGNSCRPFSIYVVTPAVSTSAQTGDLHQLVQMSMVSVDLPLFATPSTVAHVFELNTGPPPYNLVVALHRFLI
jgi:hypothetical protein